MAVPIEGFSVVAQLNRIQHLLENGSIQPPNSNALSDEHLWKCGFMAKGDAQRFMENLAKLGLNVAQGPDSDVVLATEFDRSVEPYCEWLRLAQWEKAVIAWKEGTQPKSVTARPGWDPKVGSGLVLHDPSTMHFLQFLRLENNVEVFLNKKTGQEVFIGRTTTPVDALFKTASEIVKKQFVSPGEPALHGASADDIARAAEMLRRVITECPDWWNAQWFYGKSQIALGHYETAYTAFHHAYRVEKNAEPILRELSGVCLELQRFDEAVQIGQAAVALDPSNAELLGNLSVALVLDGRLVPARKAIDAALKIAADDRINQTIARVLGEIETGNRELPKSLREFSQPVPAKKKSFFHRFWK